MSPHKNFFSVFIYTIYIIVSIPLIVSECTEDNILHIQQRVRDVEKIANLISQKLNY